MNLRRNLRRAPRRLSLVAVTLLFTLDGSSSLGRAAEASPLPAPPAKMERLDAAALAAQIDKHFEDYWQTAGVEPAPASDDAEFARRVYLILAGKTPPAAEMRDFLEDADPKKRAVLVERLLARATFAEHLANTWRDILLPGLNQNLQARALAPQFEAWLRLRIVEGRTFDQIAAELLTARAETGDLNALNPAQGGAPSPLAFYVLNELKPENLAASSSRALLGVQIQCAQCHDHPFAAWKREQFWSLAAFFKPAQAMADDANAAAMMANTGLTDNFDRAAIAIPDTDRTAEPKYLGGDAPQWDPQLGNRATLARWMVSRENPFFARATANRVWQQFFGLGLVEPVDDLDANNPASHPEVLELLASQLTAHDYDVKYLARALAQTRVFQLSSQTTHSSQEESKHFARALVRGMTAEQLFDSVAQATGYREATAQNALQDIYDTASLRNEFLQKFAVSNEKPSESQTSILQALALMNGRLVADATSLERSKTLTAVAEAPFLSNAEKVEALFLAALGRRPTPEEAAQFLGYVEGSKDPVGGKQALADVFWALLNTAEFKSIH